MTESLQFSDEEKELAILLHKDYNKNALLVGWEVQKGTFVPFDELPDKNKRTMLLTARDLLKKQKEHFVTVIYELVNRLKMDAEEQKLNNTSEDWNNALITLREEFRYLILQSDILKSRFSDRLRDPEAFVATESDNKESLVATTDSSASVANPKEELTCCRKGCENNRISTNDFCLFHIENQEVIEE